jgi:hypothetical protein
MARAGPAVAGGSGFAAGAIALDQFLYVGSVTPPVATSGPRIVSGLTAIEIPGDTGAAKKNTVLGFGADVTNAACEEAVVIGSGCTVTQGSTPTASIVVIGKGLSNTNSTTCILIGGPYPASPNNDVIMIGSSSGGTKGANGYTAIGYNMSINGSLQGVQIGQGSATHGSTAVVVGAGAGAGAAQAVVGSGSSTTGGTTNAAILGAGISVTGGGGNSVVLLGGGMNGLSALANAIGIGLGVDFTGLGAGWLIVGNNNLGTQGFTSSYLFGGADSHTTVTAVPAVLMRWKNAAGADTAAGSVTIVAPRATGNAAGGDLIFQTGVAGASSAVVQPVATVARITAGQKFQLEQDRGLAFTNQTSAAGAGAGTLSNAPAAGNPTHWLKILIGGASFAVPCWPG